MNKGYKSFWKLMRQPDFWHMWTLPASLGQGVTLVKPAVWLYSKTRTSCFLQCLLYILTRVECLMVRSILHSCILWRNQGWKHQIFVFCFLFNWEVSGDIEYLKDTISLGAPLKKNSSLVLWGCQVLALSEITVTHLSYWWFYCCGIDVVLSTKKIHQQMVSPKWRVSCLTPPHCKWFFKILDGFKV